MSVSQPNPIKEGWEKSKKQGIPIGRPYLLILVVIKLSNLGETISGLIDLIYCFFCIVLFCLNID